VVDVLDFNGSFIRPLEQTIRVIVPAQFKRTHKPLRPNVLLGTKVP